MTDHPEPVRLRTGTMPDVQNWAAALDEAGITYKIVGEDLAATFGAMLHDAIELWVHAGDAARADEVLRQAEGDSYDLSPEQP